MDGAGVDGGATNGLVQNKKNKSIQTIVHVD